LPWSRFHSPVVAPGVPWILGGLEATLAGGLESPAAALSRQAEAASLRH
jgi:hypothetical protein